VNKLAKNVFEFYGTVGVPVFYALGLYLIAYGTKIELGINFQVIGIFLTIVGIVIWILSYVSLGSHFGVLPMVQVRTKKGIYQYHKHPMYLGIMATYLGLSLANRSGTGIGFTVLLLWPLLTLRSKLEDKQLRD
jgi:protein-S-isoprenylcysteine O-methyltransferase Ste14